MKVKINSRAVGPSFLSNLGPFKRNTKKPLKQRLRRCHPVRMSKRYKTKVFSVSGTENNSPRTPTSSQPKEVSRKRGRKPRAAKEERENEEGVLPIYYYCSCNENKGGEMVECGNDICPREWFHFSCMGLKRCPPKKWYCPECRDRKSNKVKPRETLKVQLADYNLVHPLVLYFKTISQL